MNTFTIPSGYRRLIIGEIIESTDRYWHEGNGPWTTYEDEEDVIDSIGQPLTLEMVPVIRLDEGV